MQLGAFVDPSDQLVGLAGHGRNHDADLVARIDLALAVARRLADALDIGDRRAAKLHHDTGQSALSSLLCPNGRREGARSANRFGYPAVRFSIRQGTCHKGPGVTRMTESTVNSA